MKGSTLETADDEEFEPLFSYAKQGPPVKFDESDDDDDGCPINLRRLASGKRNFIDSVAQGRCQKESSVNVPLPVRNIANNDDWLMSSPPKSSLAPATTSPDSTLVQIRQKKAELVYIAIQSSRESLNKIEEAATLAARSNPILQVQDDRTHLCKKGEISKREKLLLKVQDKDEKCYPILIYKDDKFERLFAAFAKTVGRMATDFVFKFDGEQIHGNSTPTDLDIENEDMIEVSLKT